MKHSQGLFVVIMILMLTVLVAGCSQSSEQNGTPATGDQAQTTPRIAYYAHNTEPYIDLDPSVEYSNGIVTLHNIYETLTRYNDDTREVEPLLAESWEVDEDGMEWTFKIRQGVVFHDGTPLNAEAVKKSIDRTIAMNMGAAYIWDSVSEILVVDNYTVKFILDYAAPIDLVASAAYASFIMSPDAADQDSAWFNAGNASGTGPYTLQRATAGEEVLMARFDDYWQGWSANQYDRVLIRKVVESTSRRQLVENGEAQVTAGLSTSDVNALRNNPEVTVIEAAAWKNVIGFFNTQKPPLDNMNFRKAMSYAYPYQEVVENVREGLASQSYGLIPAGLWGHDETLYQYQYDLDKAQEYLDLSGINPSTVKLELTFTSGNEGHRNAAQLYQVNLRRLGIELDIREMTWDNVWEKSKSSSLPERQDVLIMYWWPDYPSPSSWLWSLVHSEEDVLFNLSYINDPALDELVQEGDMLSAVDRNQAEAIFIQVQEEVIEQAYMLHMYDDMTIYVTTNNFRGYNPNPSYEGVVFFYDTYHQE